MFEMCMRMHVWYLYVRMYIPMLHPQIVSNGGFSSSYRYYPNRRGWLGDIILLILLRFEDHLRGEHLWTQALHVFFVGAVSNLIHYIIYYNIIPLLLDISSIIINIHNNGMLMLYEWDDHGIIPSISHDFTMILPFTKHAWRVRQPGLRSDSLLTCALTLSPLSSDGKRSFGASDWCQSQRFVGQGGLATIEKVENQNRGNRYSMILVLE